MSYTQGPWTVRESYTHVTVIGANNETIFHDDKQCPSVIEDAHLISAAPDLYEALQEIVDATDTGWEHLDATFTRARAALKKARGER